DEIYAGSGDDDVFGEDGDDLIFGDSNYAGPGAGTTARESFEWDLAGVEDGQLLGSFTQNTGGVEVSFNILSETAGARTEFASNEQNVANIDADGEPVDNMSSFTSELIANGDEAVYELEFSEPTERVSFRVNDIDVSSQVQILAFDEDGNEIPVFLEAGDDVILTDTNGDGLFDTATSSGGGSPDTDPDISLLVSVEGPVARLEITHTNSGGGPSGVNVTDVYFDVPVPDDGEPGNDSLVGGIGDDTIFGEGGDDTIEGGEGQDEIDGGDGTDSVDGGAGDDVIRGGGDNDVLKGGDDADTIIIDQLGSNGVNNTTVDGNFGGDDNDTLDISPLIAQGFRVVNLVQNPENNGNPGFDGQIQLERDGEFANIEFFDIENLIICFTPGTQVATPTGTRPVEKLRAGDKVFTRDNGIQDIRWAGRRDLSDVELTAMPKFKPILIRKGALGADMPNRDMMVSPNHRMLLISEMAQVMFGEREVLVAAKHLLGLEGVSEADVDAVSYVHILFDHHEVVLGDAAWSESFQPGDHSLKGIARESREEILALFPELATTKGLDDYRAARMSLKKHEAKLLVS
ncbi:MAG: Hint domain-containing protein, partial [Pseudomonadota bacterium]